MDEGQQRKAANEALFREVNERMEELHNRFMLTEEEPFAVVCECDRLDCNERIELDVAEYERVRQDATCFIVRPGHEDSAVEDIVDTGSHHVIVRKRRGEPAEIARETDPRT